MFFNWAKTRHQARQTVHEIFAVPAFYTRAIDDAGYPITARLHRKTDTIGEGDGYAQVIVETDRVVLLDDQLSGAPERGDKVYFNDENVTATIDSVEPEQSPEIVCNVILTDGQV